MRGGNSGHGQYVAEGCRTTAAAVAGEPAATALVAATAAEAAPGATSAEGAAVWTASTPAEAATATKRAAEEPAAEPSSLEDQFFYLNSAIELSSCIVVLVHKKT
jgi:hypothetical protein